MWRVVRSLKFAQAARILLPCGSIVSRNARLQSSIAAPSRAPPPVTVNSGKKLLKLLKRLLQNRQNAYASDIFHKVMRTRFQDRERSYIFIHATNLFLKYGSMREAMQVYSYMIHERFIPPPKLKAAMHVLRRGSWLAPPNSVTILEAAQEVLKEKSFNEDCLRFLLCKLCQVFKVQPEVIDQLVETYIQHQPPGYTLSAKTHEYVDCIYSRLHSPARGGPWTKDPRVLVGEVVPQLDVELLLQLARSGSSTVRDIISVVRGAFRSSVSDGRVLCTLLALYVKHRCYNSAFVLYRLLVESYPQELDAQIFSTLFHAVSLLSRPRTFRSRAHKMPDNAPTLYELFRDMLQSHLLATDGHPNKPSAAINGTILNKAIAVFVASEDYAAAYVILRTFRMCSIPVTLDTYRSALSCLVERLDFEIPLIDLQDRPKRWWAYRFLGYPDFPSIQVDHDLISAILAVGEDPYLSLKPLALTREDQAAKLAQILLSHHRRRYYIPSALHLVGLMGAGRKVYSTIPLCRILRRAILAIPNEVFVAPAKYVSMTIREVKQEMLPKVLLRKQAGERQDDIS